MATPRPTLSQYFQLETADVVSYADDYANVQKGLESAKTSYIDQLKENAKEIKAMYDKVDQELGKFTSGQADVEFGNPSVNWDDTWRDSKVEYANLSRKIVAGQGTAADKQRISQLDAMVSSTTGNISNLTLLGQKAAEARQNPGKMGGVDMGSNNKDTLLAYEILNGNTKGSKKLVTDLSSNPPSQKWEVYNGEGALIWSESTSNIEQMLEKGGSAGITTIPDETQTMENNVAPLRIIGEDGKPAINDDFYKKDSSGRPLYKSRIINVQGVKKLETYQELDMAAIRGSIGTNIRAGAEGLSGSDKESAISLYNSVLGPGQRDPQTNKEIPFVPLNADNFVWDKETQKKYNDAYVNYNLNNFLQKDRQVNVESYKPPTPAIVSKTDRDYAQKRTVIQEDLLETAKNFDGFDQSEVGQFRGALKAIGDDGELSDNFTTNINKLGFKIEEILKDDEGNIEDIKVSPQKGSKYSSITIQPGEEIRTFLRKIQEAKGISERDAKDFTGYFDEEKSKQVNRKVRDRIDLGLVTDNQGNIIENPSKYNNYVR